MKQLLEYRSNLIARLGAAADEFYAACLTVENPFAPNEDGWNKHQLAAHTRDVDKAVYGMRIRRTAQEENPEFENFDADAWMVEHYDAGEPLEKTLGEFVESVRMLSVFLRELPVEAWNRPARHAVYGDGFCLQTWVERGLAHIEEHLASVKKIASLSNGHE